MVDVKYIANNFRKEVNKNSLFNYFVVSVSQAVKLESVSSTRNRYMAVVSTVGHQDTEESVILGIDIETDEATIGLVLPIWGASAITLDGDG